MCNLIFQSFKDQGNLEAISKAGNNGTPTRIILRGHNPQTGDKKEHSGDTLQLRRLIAFCGRRGVESDGVGVAHCEFDIFTEEGRSPSAL